MGNKNYRRGYETERKAKKELELAGYYVIRSAGSHSQFDLIALPTWKSDELQGTENDDVQPIGIQLKRQKKRTGLQRNFQYWRSVGGNN